MFGRRKRFTTSRSRDTSRRLRSATIGTHVPRRTPAPTRHMNADAVGFSNPHKKRRAARGIVGTLVPSTASGESSSQYARRISRRDFAQGMQRKARIRRIAIIACCALALIAAAGGVGTMVFFGALDDKMALSDPGVKGALAAPADADAPYYTLFSADLGTAAGMPDEPGPDALVLARIDEGARAVALISVPANLQVTLKDGKAHRLREAAEEGDAALVEAVSAFADVGIAHYVKIGAEGIERLVEHLGGIEMNLAEEVDDPSAGDTYLPAGPQSIEKDQALTVLRASNFSDGVEGRARNQCAFLAEVLERLLRSDGILPAAMQLDAVADMFETDGSARSLLDAAHRMRWFEAAQVRSGQVPGYELEREGVVYYVASSSAWGQMMETVEAGGDPQADAEATVRVSPGSFTITVRNGAAVTGGAAQMADQLKAAGFKVEEVGNTDTAAYDETLVIYRDEAREAAAETVAAALGVGRVVNGGEYYDFETEVLVVLGRDWKPLA